MLTALLMVPLCAAWDNPADSTDPDPDPDPVSPPQRHTQNARPKTPIT
jgi:hypothetical protein